jgi:hypothetical protein
MLGKKNTNPLGYTCIKSNGKDDTTDPYTQSVGRDDTNDPK